MIKMHNKHITQGNTTIDKGLRVAEVPQIPMLNSNSSSSNNTILVQATTINTINNILLNRVNNNDKNQI